MIEKIGGGSGKNSYYYGDYIKEGVYQDISNLCVQSFFGSNQKEIQQRIQSSTQKTQLYESLQPDQLRRRKDDDVFVDFCQFRMLGNFAIAARIFNQL